MSSRYGSPRTHESIQEPLHPSLIVHLFKLARLRVVRSWKRKPWERWTIRDFITLSNLLVVFWVYTLHWGERSVFKNSFDRCDWPKWENWPAGANPHHLVLVTDPQLVDPHTYPGRPWPLSTLTIRHTDLYMTRAFSKIQTTLYPDTVMFLGDLFDGGREWSTRLSKSPEERWRKYGQDFWLEEYGRFDRIFYRHWGDNGMMPRVGQPGRKLMTNLPGNHDLGFGAGIQIPVRKRFNAFFGDGNRMDVIANHTIVSLDTVSLSAVDREPTKTEEIWRPVHEFLEDAQDMKSRIIKQALRRQQGLNSQMLFPHRVVSTEDLADSPLPEPKAAVNDLPTIILTHVPLYRSPGTPCGPLRERWPPTKPPKGQKEPLEFDDRNAIAVRGGYQYQNVLSKEVSKQITEKISNIQYAFSGDDHDFCEVLHRRYPSGGGGIREITVKSTSWAMGVRKPGFLLVSLWNPVDNTGKSLESGSSIQTRLCLLPDQLGIFIKYGLLLGATIVLIATRSLLVASGYFSSGTSMTDSPILPLSYSSSTGNEKSEKRKQNKSFPGQARSHSPAGGYGLPVSQSNYIPTAMQKPGSTVRARGTSAADLHPYHLEIETVKKTKRNVSKGMVFLGEFNNSIVGVSWKSVAFYLWLVWRW